MIRQSTWLINKRRMPQIVEPINHIEPNKPSSTFEEQYISKSVTQFYNEYLSSQSTTHLIVSSKQTSSREHG